MFSCAHSLTNATSVPMKEHTSGRPLALQEYEKILSYFGAGTVMAQAAGMSVAPARRLAWRRLTRDWPDESDDGIDRARRIREV